jgi:hypothetical protein
MLMLVLGAGCARHHATVQTPAPTDAQAYPYHVPLSTPGARFGGLPQVVRETVLSEAGTAEIADIQRDASSGRMVYKIYFRDANIYPTMYVGSDGSVLRPDLSVVVPGPRPASTLVKKDDLPMDVLKALSARPTLPDITSITKEYWGDHLIYIVAFKDEIKNPKLYIVSDGTLLIQPRDAAR